MTRKTRKVAVNPEIAQADIDDIISSMGLPPSSAESDGDKKPSVGESAVAQPTEEPTLGDVYGGVKATEPSLPGFAMQDEPFTPEMKHTPVRPPPLDIVDDRPAVGRQDFEKEDSWVPLGIPPIAAAALKGIQYVQRINVLEAFQYPGTLVGAPDWIDRNWIGWQDFDEVNNIPAGPALNIPQVGVARRGDFVVQQSVMITESGISDVKLAVYRPEEFYKWFMPVTGKQ